MTVRLSVNPTNGTKFYIPCFECNLPIRGFMRGQESLETFRVEFEAVKVGEPDSEEGVFSVVTIDPNVPCDYMSQSMGNIGASPNITFGILTGLQAEPSMLIQRTRAVASVLWPRVRRFYEYYLDQQWGRFNSEGQKLFGDAWLAPSTMHERHARADDALTLTFSQCHAGNLHRTFLDSFYSHHIPALECASYLEFAKEQESSGTLQKDTRRLFDVAEHFMYSYESWLPGMTRWLIVSEHESTVQNLRLFRDDFSILRDIYQQAFEAFCKLLRYVSAAMNAAERSDVDDFGSAVPNGITSAPARHPVENIRTFDRLANADKIAYFSQDSGFESWAVQVLDRQVRNAIGHNSVRHDLRTGRVVNEKKDEVSYFEFTAHVYNVIYLLSAGFTILRSNRFLSSPDLNHRTTR